MEGEDLSGTSSDSDSASKKAKSKLTHDKSEADEPPSKKSKVSTADEDTVSDKDDDDSVSVSDVSDVDVSSVSTVDSSTDDESSDDDDIVSLSDANASSASSSSSKSGGSSSSSSSRAISSNSDSSDSDSEEDHREAKRIATIEKAKAAASAAANWVPTPPKKIGPSVNSTPVVTTKAGTDGAQAQSNGTPFKRVDDTYWGAVATKEGGAIADNSYEGAFGSSGFGVKASEKLLAVRGKDFCREKNKRKKTFNGFSKSAGGSITMNSFSTKFQYSDDE